MDDNELKKNKTLLVWRSKTVHDLPRMDYQVCQWCGTKIHWGFDCNKKFNISVAICPLCGWKGEKYTRDWYNYELMYKPSKYEVYAESSYIKEFDINSFEVELNELTEHLKNNYSDIYSLKPRKFEEIVENIYSNRGFKTVLTAATRDKGADIRILENGKDYVIIECKRYKKDRKIAVNMLDTLVGASMRWNVNKAILVTTSDFSREARHILSVYEEKGYVLDLIGANELLDLFGVYNNNLPKLHEMNSNFRDEIIEDNLRLFRQEYPLDKWIF